MVTVRGSGMARHQAFMPGTPGEESFSFSFPFLVRMDVTVFGERCECTEPEFGNGKSGVYFVSE